MKTEVVMKRELFGESIGQKSKTEFLSATDLVRAGNKWRMIHGMSPFVMSKWLQNKEVKEFIKSLESKFGKVKISGNGRGNHTWVHPYLFIDMALAISPDLKIEVYKWLYDYLLKYRNDSGDSYKKMCGAIAKSIPNKAHVHTVIADTARRIKRELCIDDWQSCSEEALETRDMIHENISLLSDILPLDKAIDIGIKKAIDSMAIKHKGRNS